MFAIAGTERVMDDDAIIVSKTNIKGHLVYANDIFLDIADFTADEVLGKPHSIVRNEAMPRCIFKLLWETIAAGEEIFAYVVNRTRDGDHYWVLAHVTPSYDAADQLTGYHSNRRKPSATALKAIKSLYEILLAEEARHANRKDGMAASSRMLADILKNKGLSYDQFILAL